MNWKDDSKFPGRLRQVREKAGLSQSEFADRVGVSRGAISTYELGDRVPDIRFLEKVIEEFGCSYDYLMGKAEAMTASSVELSKETGLNDDALRLVIQHSDMLNVMTELAPEQMETAFLLFTARSRGLGLHGLLKPQLGNRYDALHDSGQWDIYLDSTLRDLQDAAKYAGYKSLSDDERRQVHEMVCAEESNSTKSASWTEALKRSLAAEHGYSMSEMRPSQPTLTRTVMDDMKRYAAMYQTECQSGISPFSLDYDE